MLLHIWIIVQLSEIGIYHHRLCQGAALGFVRGGWIQRMASIKLTLDIFWNE